MNSRQQKLQLFIILSQAFGLIVTLLCSFLGGLYIFDGEWLYAFPISIFFVVVMYYLVIFFCKEKENRKKKGYPPIFFYLFGLYAILSIVLSFFVLHFYNVEFNEKEEIQRVGLSKVEGLKQIYQGYDSKSNEFLTRIESELNKDLTTYKEEPNKRIPIEAKLNACPYHLDSSDIIMATQGNESISEAVAVIIAERKKGFQNIKESTLRKKNTISASTFESFIEKQSNIIKGWDRFSIGKSIHDLNNRISDDYEPLNSFLYQESCERYSILFNIQNYQDETFIAKPFDLAAKHLGPMTLLVLLLFQLLILLPYFLTKGKMYGLK
jgi:ABC-type multidrug transport system fused ATPase/permease subunit